MGRDDRLDSLPSGPPGSSRTAAQHDRDRILYSSAFRRLAGVTQVAATAEGHTYHNRLTHTLEVAQLARRIAERVGDNSDQGLLNSLGGVDPDAAEAAALAHDLGHPPFGHVGESELDAAMRTRAGVADGFEGNAQSFRIVTSLAMRSVATSGLNLSRGTLNGVLKYPWARGTSGKDSRKFGFYAATEQACFDFARAEALGPRVLSLEAEIMNWADDVAYAIHDVFDFYRAGLIPLHMLAHNEAEWRKFIENVRAHWASRPGSPTYDEPLALSIRVGLLEGFIPNDPFNSSAEQRGQLRSWSTMMIGRFVSAEAFDINDNFSADSAVKINPDRRLEVDLLKELTRYYVITNPATQTVQFGQRRIIKTLFELFFDDESLDRADDGTRTSPYPPGLADAIKGIAGTGDLDGQRQAKGRVVADAIAQLTEQQAISLYRRLTGTELGSMFDPIVR